MRWTSNDHESGRSDFQRSLVVASQGYWSDVEKAYSTFSDDFQGEEIQDMMEQWVDNVCRLSEGDMRDLLSLVKEFSLD